MREPDLIRLTCTEEEEIFYVDHGASSTVYTIDRGTLALKKIESFDEKDESYFTAKFSYGDKLPEPGYDRRLERAAADRVSQAVIL